MVLPSLHVLMLGLAPLALNGCVEIEPATGSPIPTAPVLATDLGSSNRVPQIAGLTGEGEGYRRTEPDPSPTAREAMSGTSHGSTDHGSISEVNHASTDHGSGMVHRSMPGIKHEPRGDSTQMVHSGHKHIQGTSTVNSIDPAGRKINVTHAPIPTIGWPSMTMDFAVAPSVDLNAAKPGTRIRFDMEQGQDGMYVIQSITPAGGGR